MITILTTSLTAEKRIGLFIQAYEAYLTINANYFRQEASKVETLQALGLMEESVDPNVLYLAIRNLNGFFGCDQLHRDRFEATKQLVSYTYNLTGLFGDAYPKPWYERSYRDDDILMAMADGFYQQLTQETKPLTPEQQEALFVAAYQDYQKAKIKHEGVEEAWAELKYHAYALAFNRGMSEQYNWLAQIGEPAGMKIYQLSYLMYSRIKGAQNG